MLVSVIHIRMGGAKRNPSSLFEAEAHRTQRKSLRFPTR